TITGMAAMTAGDIARPVTIINGNSAKMTARDVICCNTLYAAGASLTGFLEGKAYEILFQIGLSAMAVRVGRMSILKCRESNPEITYTAPFSTHTHAARKCRLLPHPD